MAWFASRTGSAFAVRHQPEKGRRESMRVGGVGVSGGAATPTLAGEIPGGASGPTVVRAAPGGADGRFALFDEIFSSGGDGADVHLHPNPDDAGTEASLERYSMVRRRDCATEAGVPARDGQVFRPPRPRMRFRVFAAELPAGSSCTRGGRRERERVPSRRRFRFPALARARPARPSRPRVLPTTAISRTRFPPGNRRRTGRRLLLR